ncbi:MAG: hypothetical protein IKZ99_13105 [Salinivirgaceae bacterium]|jgi:hypothetical protein|nr:hypothetical protein [Salinivirgaceae bacterium]
MEKLNFEQMECVEAGASEGGCAFKMIAGITSCFLCAVPVIGWGGLLSAAGFFSAAYDSGCFESTY